MDYTGFSFKDLTIFQGFKPDPADPDMWGWWDADYYVDNVKYVGLWGDASDHTANKAIVGGRNLDYTSAGYQLTCSTADDSENVFRSSEDWHSGQGWTKSNFTSSAAKVGAFTAQNGYARSIVERRYYTPGSNYTFSIKLKNNTGNTNLQIFGDSTNQDIVVDGTLTEYSMTFNAPVSGDFYCGVRDTNAAGHGQIEFDQAHCYLTSGLSTYVQTTLRPRIHGVNGHRFIGINTYGANSALEHSAIGAGNGLGGACTIYWAGRFVPFASGKMMFLLQNTGTYNYMCQTDGTGASARMRLYTNAGGAATLWTTTGWIQDYTWYIFCAIANLGSSIFRIHDGTTDRVFNGALTAVDAGDGYFRWLGGDGWAANCVSFDLMECIGYYSAHDTSKQNQHISYLRTKLGI